MEESNKKAEASKALNNLRMRLLDLTGRNRLINFRHTKKASLRIIDELPNQLVDTLLSDSEMRFEAISEPTEDELIEAGYLEFNEEEQKLVEIKKYPSAEEWGRCLGFATSYEVPEQPVDEDESGKHSDLVIQTLLYPFEMEARLKGLLQSSESAIQEMGANILYLAFGFLEWYDAVSETPRIAPLFLVPVRLYKGRLNPLTRTYEYTLSYSGEDIIPNLSLREKLRADFAMALPDLDGNTIPEQYFTQVQSLINENQPRWRLRRYISMALLNFSKLLMYLDLDPERWPEGASIIDHEVVSRFLSGYTEKEDDGGNDDLGFGEEYSIDDMEDIHEHYPLIDDADSSQHSALIDAVDGKNLVIEGPPGTGKSQTITNLIAATMAQGKKVLFVAEKLAALEVVRSRLDDVGLGQFCLELHSHKSQKRKVLDEVGLRLKKSGKFRKPKDIDVEISRYEELKGALKFHVEKINRPWKNTGKTLHEILVAATRYRNELEINPEQVHPLGYDGRIYDVAVQRRNEDQVEAYGKVYQAIAEQLGEDAVLHEHPWYGICNGDLQIFDLDRVNNSLERWQKSLLQLADQRGAIANTLGCDATSVARSLPEFESFLQNLQRIPSLKGDELLDRLPVLKGDVLQKAIRYLKLFDSIQEQFTRLEKMIGSGILQDLSIVDQLVEGSIHLRRLVGQKIELGRLAEALHRLSAIEDQLLQLNEPLKGVVSAMGNVAPNFLSFSESGLREFKAVISLIASLSPSHWKQRDELFDNDELDEILPQLRFELELLLGTHEKVHSVYSLDNLPDEHEIRLLSGTLASGGFFSWLKSDWRAARKQVFGFAVNPQLKYSSLSAQLDDLAEFVEMKRRFEGNTKYRDVVGEHLKGIDTDIAALESIRAWYKEVRQRYGVGFGKKVPIGDAIIGLSPSIAKAVRSLVDSGLGSQIDDLLDDLGSLKEVFSPVDDLRDDETLLVGEGGIIPQLSSDVASAVRSCGTLAGNDALTMQELGDRIEKISVLRKQVVQWQQANFDNRLFGGRLGLQVGVGVDNSVGRSILNNTLHIANCVENGLNHQVLADYIFDHPVKSTFDRLSVHFDHLGKVESEQQAAYKEFSDLVRLDMQAWADDDGGLIDDLLPRNQLALDNGETLQSWLDYVRVRDQVQALGMGNIAENLERGLINVDQVGTAYQAGICDVLAREILREDPELGRFSGHSQEAIQDKFKEYDNSLKRLQCEHIAWKIDQNPIPSGNMGARVSEKTERILLEHECAKQTRHIPIRQLLHRSGGALSALKPCFMMGPMSVAQYLAPGEIDFDLVVMDEASQIKPQDALGAAARGMQFVVVGDPKQLPPTSFFDRIVEDDEDDPTGIEESESILDATLPMFPARRLRWHYRSQHESLIAFSNNSFYDSDLVLFPSPYKETDNFGIQFSRVPRGCFVNRRNMEEARIISEAVLEHFKHRPEESLGVVAMSAEQRTQIERAIETLAKDDASFQMLLDEDATRRESLFVKNLENVQGDERDVIFISMTYGPQEPNGKVLQRFGPINSEVGWRRLNVLFTRSKKRMHIFSSMGSDNIVADASKKRGVHALRDFLSFCETGILHKTEHDTGRRPDSDFEISVMDALRNAGFECVPQVGVAGFYIDVAVVDPGNPGRYLMGIECDGATYHSAKSVRDRDRLRQTVLERLGWNIRRIWSTDWFKNPHGELAPIIRELHELKSEMIEEIQPETELEEIEEIIQEVEVEEAQVDDFAFETGDLHEKLSRFDNEIIRKDHPETEESRRLLRPSMLEALIEFTPTSKVEFLELIPPYLRQATDPAEGQYLEQVFDIINTSLELS